MAFLSTEMSAFAVILALLTLRDLLSLTLSDTTYSSSFASKAADIDDLDNIEDSQPNSYWKLEKGGPGSKITSYSKFLGPTIKILYCSSGGYKNAFDQYVEFIHEKYPEISVDGTSYPLPVFRRVATQVLTVVKFLLLGAMLANQWSALRLLGLPERIIAWISENKVYAALLSFFLMNLIETQLGSTGAFEVYIDDVPVWSKLQTGRLPHPPELVQMIENHLKLGAAPD